MHGHGRIQDGTVAGASAEVARDGFHGLFAADGAALGAVVEVVQTHDKPRGAKTALRSVVVHHGLLHRMQLAVGRQIAGGGDLQAVGRMRHADAAVDRVGIFARAQHHGASAAVARGATFFAVSRS